MNENKLKKLMWTGLIIEGFAFIIMIVLIIISNPIPDLVAQIFVLGMIVTIISSIALAAIKNRKKQDQYYESIKRRSRGDI